MISLQMGEDVLAVLPTGFGKSEIFTVFALSVRNLNRPVSVLVICQLKSEEHYIGLNCSIVNRWDWFGSSANIKGANKDAKI